MKSQLGLISERAETRLLLKRQPALAAPARLGDHLHSPDATARTSVSLSAPIGWGPRKDLGRKWRHAPQIRSDAKHPRHSEPVLCTCVHKAEGCCYPGRLKHRTRHFTEASGHHSPLPADATFPGDSPQLGTQLKRRTARTAPEPSTPASKVIVFSRPLIHSHCLP